MIKSKFGPITNPKTGQSKDIVIDALSKESLRDILLGVGVVMIGITYLSLSYQWMTTEVLTKTLGDYADETTAIGKKAFAAAQDIKTFTQLMDTLKEAAGSGWAETWEIVLGNFDEAKALWTEVGDVIGGFIDAQSKARNEMLQEWKDLGGRADLIEAFKNAFEGLVSIVTPVKEAFREIFPATTGKQLADITKKIKEITANFKISDTTSENLKNTFKGLFAAIDIIGQASCFSIYQYCSVIMSFL